MTCNAIIALNCLIERSKNLSLELTWPSEFDEEHANAGNFNREYSSKDLCLLRWRYFVSKKLNEIDDFEVTSDGQLIAQLKHVTTSQDIIHITSCLAMPKPPPYDEVCNTHSNVTEITERIRPMMMLPPRHVICKLRPPWNNTVSKAASCFWEARAWSNTAQHRF